MYNIIDRTTNETLATVVTYAEARRMTRVSRGKYPALRSERVAGK